MIKDLSYTLKRARRILGDMSEKEVLEYVTEKTLIKEAKDDIKQ